MKPIEERLTPEKITDITLAFYSMANELDVSQQDAFYCILQHATSTAVEALGTSEAENTLRKMFSMALDVAREEIKEDSDKSRLN